MQNTVIQIKTGYKYNFKLKVIIIIFFKFSVKFKCYLYTTLM